jgi:hypothetical protein
MYYLYTNDEFLQSTPSLKTAKAVAVSLFKSLGKDIFVWREKKGKKSELILEVIDETRVPTIPA